MRGKVLGVALTTVRTDVDLVLKQVYRSSGRVWGTGAVLVAK